jgi:hypothetical protein
MKILTKALVLLTIPLLSVGTGQTDLRPHPTPTRTYILDRISRLTGLESLFEVESIENVPASNANIPFLAKELEGKTAIKVTFKRGKLKFKFPRGGLEDKYDGRRFVVLLDADAKRLLSVTSTIPIKDPDIHPEESLDNIEVQLRANGGESYQSFPALDPKITFLDALESLQRNHYSPLVAQEIDGFCVMHSEMDGAPTLKWIVTLRGIPPRAERPSSQYFDGHGPKRSEKSEPEPIWQRNYLHEFVDATTGAWLSSETLPFPKP